jgi:pimeloyl-ACP methyl ester carboxylesterase
MRHVTSEDGSVIAVEEHGDRRGGPVAVLLGGALNDRARLRPLAEALAGRVAAVTVDRRGRGDSTDASGGTADGALAREIADVRALVDDLGGDVTLVGFSSGGQLSAAAVVAGVPAARVVLLEPPFVPPGSPPPADRSAELAALVQAGQRDEAVVVWMRDIVGMPAQQVESAQGLPFWPALLALAPTLVYDAAVSSTHADPASVAGLGVPVLVVRGREASPFLTAAADGAVAAIPGARLALVDGVGHEPDLAQVADEVVRFVTA